MDEKQRIVSVDHTGPWSYWYNSNWTTDPSLGNETKGSGSSVTYLQKTSSRGHAWPSAGPALTDIGGNFSTSRIAGFYSPTSAPVRSWTSYGYTYQGSQYPSGPGSAMQAALDEVAFSSEAKLQQLGTTAIAKCIPTNPVADAGTFIGELKEGLPKVAGKELFKSKFKDYRKYGSEYLNIEFGWKPLVSDLQKFGEAAMESEKILDQLHRDSGKNIRRKYTFPEEVTQRTVVSNNRLAYCQGLSLYPYVYTQPAGGPLTVVVNTKVRTWFSGCFTYHLNLGNTLPDRISRHAAEARKLFGIELTPETVWNLAPWSWAVDWEGNIGDVLHNVSRFAQDGLVMRYGYIMQEKTCKIDYTLHPNGSLGGKSSKELKMSVTAVSKIRRRATPFGFGFDMTALTGRQSAILGALGISRGPRHL